MLFNAEARYVLDRQKDINLPESESGVSDGCQSSVWAPPELCLENIISATLEAVRLCHTCYQSHLNKLEVYFFHESIVLCM